MSVSKKSTGTGWIDPDDAPDLSAPAWQVKLQKAIVRRGRPKSSATKVSTTIRFDADVLDALKGTGPGWQTRANAILRSKLLPKSRKSLPKSA